MLQEVSEIWWATSMQSLENYGGEFELYAPLKRKPVKLLEEYTGIQWRMKALVQCTVDSLKAQCILQSSTM